MNGGAGELLQVVVKDFGVRPFLTGGIVKNRFNNGKLHGTGLLSRKGVAVAGLALSGKGTHQVFACFAFLKFNCHKNAPSCFWR